MGNKALISVIIPLYNREDYIYDTVMSALNQTYQNIEVIVVDDGSTDRSGEIVKKIQDNRLKYIYQENSGQPANPRNHGMRVSKGDYIAFLDSDDLWYPQKLEKQLQAFKNYKKYDVLIVGANVDFIPNKNKKMYRRFKNINIITYKMLLKQNQFVNSTTMIKSDVINKIGYLDENPDLRALEDYDYWLRILNYKDKSGILLSEILGSYRLHDNNISKDCNDNYYQRHLNKLKSVYIKHENNVNIDMNEIMNFLNKKFYSWDMEKYYLEKKIKINQFICNNKIFMFIKIKGIIKKILSKLKLYQINKY